MKLIAYLTHPLGERDSTNEVQRRDNIADATEWFRFLVERTSWAILCPWLGYVMSADDPAFKPRALVDQLSILERADMLVMCGTFVSPHMRYEREHARKLKLPVIDLTTMHPPWRVRDAGELEVGLMARTMTAFRARPRRVWMPPLEESDVHALRAICAALRPQGLTDQEMPWGDALKILDEVISKATEKPI
jgi:hypothetical protein